MKAALIKLLLSIAADEKARKKLWLILFSVIAGLLGMMCLPFIVLCCMHETSVPEVSISDIDLTEFTENIDKGQAEKLEIMGNVIAETMAVRGLQKQTVKAQLIWLSFFQDREITDISKYADIFSCPDDRVVINRLNENYRLNIDYEEFMRSYTLIMNTTVNPYLFTNPETKNSADLASWAENAWVSGWGFDFGTKGEISPEKHYRTTDNVGLIMGYLDYHPDEKTFSDDFDTLYYTEHSSLDSMPDIAGIGVYNGEEFGIYIGNGQVIFCSESIGHAEKTALHCGIWSSWCTFDAIEYPPEVRSRIEELNHHEREVCEDDN